MKTIQYSILVLLVLIVTISPANSQITNTECQSAETWHLQQAMKWSQAIDQEYHLGAAEAARLLNGKSGSPCAGWEQDNQRPQPVEAIIRGSVSGDAN